MGFLLEFAKKCLVCCVTPCNQLLGLTVRRSQDAAQEANFLNILGYPRFSTFVTYDYSATSHLDKDEAPSSGWVIRCPDQVHLALLNKAE